MEIHNRLSHGRSNDVRPPTHDDLAGVRCFVEHIALEIFQSVASIFQEEATAKVMPLIIELMIHGQIP